MSPFTWGAIYLTIWWTVLFAILPLGVVSWHEAGITPPAGSDPSSPVDPKLKRKFITTSWVSALATAVLWALLHFHVIRLPTIPVS